MTIASLPETVTLRGTFGELFRAARDEVAGFVNYPGRLVFVALRDGRIGEVVS